MHRFALAALLLALITLPVGPASAEVAPRTATILAWESFAAEQPGARVAWDGATGGVRSILLPVAAGGERAAAPADAERIARFLANTPPRPRGQKPSSAAAPTAA
jgi:hypothetical protein